MSQLSSIVLFALGAALYAAASVLFFANAARGPARVAPDSARTEASPRSRAPLLLGAGTVAHLAYITVASFVAHSCPVGSVHFLLSAIAIAASGAFALARRNTMRRGPADNIDALGLVVAPLGLAFLLGTYFIDKPTLGTSLGAGFIAMHVVVNVVGVALFSLAGAAAVLYLVQERRLKRKKLGRIAGLPPLDTLDRALHRFLLIGFPLATVGVLSGTFWAQQLESGSPKEVMRILFGYATWLLVGGVLLLRTAAGWSGKRSAYGTILGVLCAMSVLAVYVVRPGPSSEPNPSSEPTSSGAAP